MVAEVVVRIHALFYLHDLNTQMMSASILIIDWPRSHFGV